MGSFLKLGWIRLALAKPLVLHQFVLGLWLDTELLGRLLGKVIEGIDFAVEKVLVYGLMPCVQQLPARLVVDATHFKLIVVQGGSALALELPKTRRAGSTAQALYLSYLGRHLDLRVERTYWVGGASVLLPIHLIFVWRAILRQKLKLGKIFLEEFNLFLLGRLCIEITSVDLLYHFFVFPIGSLLGRAKEEILGFLLAVLEPTGVFSFLRAVSIAVDLRNGDLSVRTGHDLAGKGD